MNTDHLLSKSMYIDFHAHNVEHQDDVFTIRSYFLNEFDSDVPDDNQICSVGLHPWHADLLSADEVKIKLNAALEVQQVVFVGEAGLDKIKGADWKVQQEKFKLQAALAEENQKTLIVHSVRSHQEILQERMALNARMPWVIHGFSGSKNMAMDLIKHGFYLSVGHLLLNQQSRLSTYFEELPLEKIFLETDDFDVSIYELYRVAAEKKGMAEEKLKEKLVANLKILLHGK